MTVEITVRLPPELLDRLDARAAELCTGRNGLIVDALSTALETDGEWFRDFLSTLDPTSRPENASTLDDLTRARPSLRTGKGFRDLW